MQEANNISEMNLLYIYYIYKEEWTKIPQVDLLEIELLETLVYRKQCIYNTSKNNTSSIQLK